MIAARADIPDAEAQAARRARAADRPNTAGRAAPLPFGSKKLMPLLAPDASPSALPVGCSNPLGNGLSMDVIGTLLFCDQRRRLRIAGRGDRAVVPGRPEHAVAAAKHRVVVDLEHGAGPRRRLDRRRAALLSRCAVDAGVDQSALHLAGLRMQRIEPGRDRHVQRARRRGVEADRELIVSLGQAGFVLEPNPVVDGEAIADAVVVLRRTPLK